MYIPSDAQVGVMRVQDMTMKRTQMAAATEYTALIVSTTLASTILLFRDANGLMLVPVYIEANC